MNTFIKVGAAAGVLALLIAVILAFKGPTTNTVTVTNPDGTTQQVGAATGPDSFFQTETHNGIGYTFDRRALSVGTTTSCAIKSPSATSSLKYASMYVKTNFVSATLSITVGSAMQASTTNIAGSSAIAAAAQGMLVAASSTVVSPNNWVDFNVTGGTGTASSTGTCQADFIIM